MTRIDFYSNTRDKLDVVRKLVVKIRQTGESVLIHVADDQLAEQLDSYLWTSPPLSFLAHVRCGHPLARHTPVLIGNIPDELPAQDVLINLERETPAFFSRFTRLLEIVGTDAEDIQAGRGRYRFYQERGYELKHYDMTGK
jgi:DNA polymerase-3 subunit chi